jgi:aryl sulfotransferase
MDLSRQPVRYRTHVTDSARWAGFEFRPDDTVISTPAKCGTTWMQMICALLLFGTTQLPAPLSELSPWLDQDRRPPDVVFRQLQAQRHRRFIKTHTPLDGLPSAPGVSYVVVGRDPRDVAVSMYHHRGNLRPAFLERLAVHTGQVQAGGRGGVEATAPSFSRREFLLRWIEDDTAPTSTESSLRSVVAHLDGAWKRRHEPQIIIVHYGDLARDLEGEMRRLARRLHIDANTHNYPTLASAATFSRMRARAQDLVPDGVFVDRAAFFHSGSSGLWREDLTNDDVARYQQRLASLATADLVRWLHHGRK